MFDDPFSGFPAQVKAIKTGITLLQKFDNPQGLLIMFKSAKIFHQPFENMFTRMPEWCMAKIM